MTGSIKFFSMVKMGSVLATLGMFSACATPSKNVVSQSDWGYSNEFPDQIMLGL